MADIRTIDDLDVAGKRVLVRVDFNVPMKDGKVTEHDPHRPHRAVAAGARRQGRQGDHPQPPRPAEGQEEPGVHPEAGGRGAGRGAGQAGGVRARLHRAGSKGGGRQAAAGRVRHAGERPLLRRRRKERSGVRQEAGGAGRRSGVRRLFLLAPRPRLGRGAGEADPFVRRPADAGGDRGAVGGAGSAEAAGRRRWSAAPRSRPSSTCSATSPRRSTR